MDQAFDTFLDFDKTTVVGDVRDLAEQTRAFRITAGNIDPGISTHLLQAERDTIALAIELQDFHIKLIANIDHFGGMLDALPGHIGDMQQTVDATEINKGTVVSEVLH